MKTTLLIAAALLLSACETTRTPSPNAPVRECQGAECFNPDGTEK